MKRFETIVKWIVPLVVLYLLYVKVTADLPTVSNILNNLRFTGVSALLVALLLVLMFANWLLEAIKWQWLIHFVEPISVRKAVVAILNGLAYGLLTPFRVGDILTRIFHLRSDQRSRALGSVLVSRSAQLVSTVLMGLAGLSWYGCSSYPWVWLGSLCLALVSLWIHYRIRYITPLLSKINILSTYLPYVQVLTDYQASDYTKALIISLLRYGVIMVQYGLMFSLYGIDITVETLFVGVSVTLLVKSLLPIISIIGDFGVREIVAVYIFALFGYSANQVLMVTISIWLLNIVLPSVVGLFLSKNMRIKASS